MSGLIKTAKLWAKTSERSGRTYLTGRWGGCRVLIFENDKEGDGEPTHWLMLGDADQGQQPAPAQHQHGQRSGIIDANNARASAHAREGSR